MFKAYPGGFYEVDGVVEVGRDDGVVALGVGDVGLVVRDAAVFLHIQFVAVGVYQRRITLVFGEIMCVDPEPVVGGSVVPEHAGRHVGSDAEGDEEARDELSAEEDLEMLLFVASGHHITHLGVGQHALVADHVAFIDQISGEGGEAHVESVRP